MKNEEFMALAIKEAYDGINNGDGGPFGCLVVKSGEVLSSSHNTVLKSNDPTQHAEVNAISLASKKLGNFDLSGCDIYTTTEPCPMCFSAIHWSRINCIYFGTKIEDVAKLGFNELTISPEKMKEKGSSKVKIIGPILKDRCEELLKDWDNLPNKKVY